MNAKNTSFSYTIKEELFKLFKKAKKSNMLEFSAIISLVGIIKISEYDEYKLFISTEYEGLFYKCFTILVKTFNIEDKKIIVKEYKKKKNLLYTLSLEDDKEVRNILKKIDFLNSDCLVLENLDIKTNKNLKKEEYKRAFLRGTFLAVGSISNPNKSYHLEFVFSDIEKAKQIKDLLECFFIYAKILSRKKNYILYLKDSEQISSFLALIEAPLALLELENIKVYKNVRNDINRKVNCETANINKTVSAAIKQIKDIEYIKENYGIEKLPLALRDIANKRLKYPEVSLSELCLLLEDKISKSGANHRLRKISEIALLLGKKE